MGHNYLILGAGKQGVAAAYDVLRFGDADRVTLADNRIAPARDGVRRLNALRRRVRIPSRASLRAAAVDGRNPAALRRLMAGHRAVLSALPYYLNPGAAAAAVAARVHYADLGGYFESTRRILALHRKALKAGVTLVPDLGVSPGLCNALALCGMERLDAARDVLMYCGGLPQKPREPLGYKVVFNLEGLLGNYVGEAWGLWKGRLTSFPPFSGRETVDLGPPLGRLEAMNTGGATSTCPWTFRGKLRTFVYKTLRYPGHFDKIRFLRDLGLLDAAPVTVDGALVAPRKFLAAVAEPHLRFPDDRDLLALRVIVRGRRGGRPAEVRYDVLDRYDPRTGFTAMQRTTGFTAAVVLEMLARGEIARRGAVPLEKAVSGRRFLEEFRRRGVRVRERFRRPTKRRAW